MDYLFVFYIYCISPSQFYAVRQALGNLAYSEAPESDHEDNPTESTVNGMNNRNADDMSDSRGVEEAVVPKAQGSLFDTMWELKKQAEGRLSYPSLFWNDVCLFVKSYFFTFRKT